MCMPARGIRPEGIAEAAEASQLLHMLCIEFANHDMIRYNACSQVQGIQQEVGDRRGEAACLLTFTNPVHNMYQLLYII